jgi:hypothetical protein
MSGPIEVIAFPRDGGDLRGESDLKIIVAFVPLSSVVESGSSTIMFVEIAGSRGVDEQFLRGGERLRE